MLRPEGHRCSRQRMRFVAPHGPQPHAASPLSGLGSALVLRAAHRDLDDPPTPVFQQACKMDLEGIVSKRLSAHYRSGPSRDWIKVKNPDNPAMIRARDAEW
jgi:hypothetical protein